ncbi:MAG: superoxide dismutase family protein [Sphingomonas bacterium]|nr:superoxide dismutase family protein [Sphingomonas bacterium]
MTRIPSFTILTIAGSALALGACMKAEAPVDNAVANDVVAGNAMAGNAIAGAPAAFFFKSGAAAELGTVTVSEDPAGLMLNLSATGMPAGVHGIHLHETGLCDGPKFESAGKHWNPAGKQHGRDNPAGAHAGDLANLTIAADGSAKVSIPIAGAMIASGAMMLADADGTALVVHAKPDDYKTDPSGDSGDRIACAVLAAVK